MPRVAILRHQGAVISEPFVLEQARAFQELEAVLVTRDAVDPAAMLPDLPRVSIEEHCGPGARLRYGAAACAGPLTRTLRAAKVDLVLAHFAVEGSFALRSARQLGVPLATIFHGFDATSSTAALVRSRRAAWLHHVRLRGALRRDGDLFLPVSDHLRRRMLQDHYPQARTRTHYTGLDLEKLPLPVPSTERSGVLHVARLVEKKGTSHLLRAVARMVDRGVSTTVTIVGEGPLRADLERMADDLGIGCSVTFTGALDNDRVLALMARTAVVCLPSVTASSGDQEGLPHVLLEAAALGVPVVASRSGGIPEAVIDGQTGLLTPEADHRDLADALERLLVEPDVAGHLGRAARRRVQESFDVRRQTRRLEQMLLAL